MSFNTSLLIAFLVAIGALQINSAALGVFKNSTSNGNDLILGEVTPNSRLIHSERMTNGFFFYWGGPFNIVKVEALDQTAGLGGRIYEWFGGVNTRQINLFLEGSPIDFIVNIYVENFPQNDYISGNLTENSILLFNERTTGQNVNERSVYWRNTSYIITRMEAFDQTNGSGGEVEYVDGGVDRRSATIYFGSRFMGSSIDFILYIYGEPVTTNDRNYGDLTNTSVLVQSSRLTVSTPSIFTEWRGPHTITYFEVLDQSNGTGGFVNYIRGGILDRYVYVFFETMDDSSTIDFITNIYAEPLSPNHFFDGELTNTSEHLHHERIIGTYGNARLDWNNENYVITRIEARDQSNGAGGEVNWFVGGVNFTYFELAFYSVYNLSIIDFIVDIYGEYINGTLTTPISSNVI